MRIRDLLWRRLRRAQRHPAEAIALLLATVTCVYVIGGPLLASHYPIMQDAPFHAANAAVFKNYFDPAWHFREQFELQPFAVPYVTMYLIAAGCMFFMSAVSAIKVAAFVMLALLPAGLAVMFHGMRKSPLLGLTGLAFVWCGLTHWGFLNFMGALGLFAMAIGLSLRLVDKPRVATASCLTVVLLVLFFTHPFRFPFAICAVVGCGVVMYPATKRFRPLLWPLLGPSLLFASWFVTRPVALAGEIDLLSPDPGRLAEVGDHLYRSLLDPREAQAFERASTVMVLLALGLSLLAVIRARRQLHSRRERWWFAGSHVAITCCTAVLLWMYLSLPMEITVWWYVYPREITATLFVALGLLPDLPRSGWWKLGVTIALCWALVPLGQVVIEAHRQFDRSTRDFDAIVDEIPRAPKLLYLIFDHRGHTSRRAPFIHLPAYVQAERGGWLSFHFAMWGASPVVYWPRDAPGAVVPPPRPLRWEWTPSRFRALRDGAWFDWFLVRSAADPSHRFADDPAIEQIARKGRWWLYRRR